MSEISRDEFQNFRDDTKEHFDMLHACDQRIESKIDTLIDTMQTRVEKQAEKQGDNRFKLKLGVFTASLALVFGIIGAAITTFFRS